MDVENLSIEIVQTLIKSSPLTLSIIQLIICEKTMERLNFNSSEGLIAKHEWGSRWLICLEAE